MREILFRGKTKGTRFTESKWVEGFYYIHKGKYAGSDEIDFEHPTITTGIVESSGGYGERTEHIESKVIPETVGQYTGLTDKNGVKIFEGDIVLYAKDEEVGQIAYHESEAMFVVEFDTWLTDFDHMCGIDLEVIGNIHDNPELIKGALKDE